MNKTLFLSLCCLLLLSNSCFNKRGETTAKATAKSSVVTPDKTTSTIIDSIVEDVDEIEPDSHPDCPDPKSGECLFRFGKDSLYYDYGNTSSFMYLGRSDGSWFHLWCIYKVERKKQSIQMTLGMRNFVFPKDVDLRKLVYMYNPLPKVSKFIQRKHTLEYNDTVYGRAYVNVTYPVGALGGNKWLKKWINKTLNGDNSRNTYAKCDSISIYKTYFKDFDEDYDLKEMREDHPSVVCYYDSQTLISLQWKSANNKILTYFIGYNAYYGGAHGSIDGKYRTLDLSRNKELTFDDLIIPEKRLYVRKLLLRKIKKVSTSENSTVSDADYLALLYDCNQLFDKPLNSKETPCYDYLIQHYKINNPGLTDKGLVLCYLPYDIGSFGDDNTMFILSYDELKGCINSKYINLIR